MTAKAVSFHRSFYSLLRSFCNRYIFWSRLSSGVERNLFLHYQVTVIIFKEQFSGRVVHCVIVTLDNACAVRHLLIINRQKRYQTSASLLIPADGR